MDTGTTYLRMPRKDIDLILATIPRWEALNNNLGRFSVPCDTTIDLKLTFRDRRTFKTTTFAIDPATLIWMGQDRKKPNDCNFGIVAGPDDTPWLVRVW
jgi:hypothetical protein